MHSLELLMWTERPSETCSVSFQKWNEFDTLLHLVGFIIEIILRCTTLWTSNWALCYFLIRGMPSSQFGLYMSNSSFGVVAADKGIVWAVVLSSLWPSFDRWDPPVFWLTDGSSTDACVCRAWYILLKVIKRISGGSGWYSCGLLSAVGSYWPICWTVSLECCRRCTLKLHSNGQSS